ncbi:MAG: glycoside hydrolase family 3 C-terminal domain-containing protein, partial [Flavobacteriaceae bacterium]
GTKFQWKALTEAAEKGDLSRTDIDTSVKRILKLILESKKMQNYAIDNKPELLAHAKIARQSAAEGMVLLKNENVLPMVQSKNVALLGVTSYDFIAGGTGSGDVNEAYTVSLEEGLKNAGYAINTIAKEAFEVHKNANKKAFIKPQGFKAMFQPYTPPQLQLTEAQLNDVAANADIAILTIGRNSGEGSDRVEKDDFLLTQQEQDMIATTCTIFHEAGKKVIVVLNIGGVIETSSWKQQPDAILLAWQGGQESGNAVADILKGTVNPSGKLPMTFPVHLNDHASNANFPLDGEPMDIPEMILDKEIKEEDKERNKDYTLYEEGIYVGYRHFDKANVAVSYPFGYGLSYTNFEMNNLDVSVANDTINVTVSVQNTGNYAGKEVVQVYVSKPNTTIDRPIKELKAFAKTPKLNTDESVAVVLRIPVAELRYWDEANSTWALEKGMYQVQTSASSRDIGLSMDIEI